MRDVNSAMNQSERVAIILIHVTGAKHGKMHGNKFTIGFGFASHWLKKWREFYKPISERSKVKTKAITKLLSTVNSKLLYIK